MLDNRTGYLTNKQRSYIIALRQYEVGQGGRTISVTGKFFEELLCMAWGTANRKHLEGCALGGYLKIIEGGNKVKFYSLTAKGRKVADSCINAAKPYQWEIDQPELFGGENVLAQ